MFCLHGMSMFQPEANIAEENILGNIWREIWFYLPTMSLPILCAAKLKLQSTRTTVPAVMTRALQFQPPFKKFTVEEKMVEWGCVLYLPTQVKQECLHHSRQQLCHYQQTQQAEEGKDSQAAGSLQKSQQPSSLWAEGINQTCLPGPPASVI